MDVTERYFLRIARRSLDAICKRLGISLGRNAPVTIHKLVLWIVHINEFKREGLQKSKY